MLEAIRLVERGEATAKDVDIAMKLGAGCKSDFLSPRQPVTHH